MSRSSRNSPRNTQIFTERQIVGRMCELCEPTLSDIKKTVFEPSCGSGNFLVEVLHRRLLAAKPTPYDILIALSRLYGVDVDEKLVFETRRRLRAIILDFASSRPEFDDKFFALVDKILVANIVCGDLLKNPEKLTFSEWGISDSLVLSAKQHTLAEIMAASQSSVITPRIEQRAAIDQTVAYWQEHHAGDENSRFLWNAKPRFGKTFTAYQFVKTIKAQRILIVSNRPAISDSWQSDFCQFVAPVSEFIFASAKGSDVIVNGRKTHICSRAELLHNPELLARPLFFFISLQDLKGKNQSGDFKAKNQWIFRVKKPWDLLIVDESHDGVNTEKTRQALAKIKADFTLHLSGTPFRALTTHEFSKNQIYNWTYLDEQRMKSSSAGESSNNPYEILPQLKLYTYQLRDYFGKDFNPQISNSNELFRVKGGKFLHETLVCRWLDLLSAEKSDNELSYSLPFTTEQNRQYFRHTFWLLSHIDECRALANLLRDHPFFHDYEVVVVAGKDDAGPNDSARALARVRRAIGSEPLRSRTITLSCGRLTTGITVPEWTAVLMLGVTSNLAKISSAQYLQAAFRAQNPWQADGFMKKSAYIFDWSSDRAMLAVRDYAVNLCNNSASDIAATLALLKYLPIYASSPNGEMAPLSAEQIVTLPAQLAAQEIVDGGFVSSDKLFRLDNIAALSPSAHRVLNKIYALGKHGFESTPQPFMEAVPSTTGPNVLKKKDHRRSHKKKIEESCREKLRGFTSTIPLLLHLYGMPSQDLRQLVEAASDDTFSKLTGISKADFRVLAKENFFDEANCSAAIAEFMAREESLANYCNLSAFQTIFDYIPPQRQYVFTPLLIVERMLDYLEAQRPDVFHSPDSTFLDLCSKGGIFSAALAYRLFRNLRPSFSSDHDCLLHIFTHQIYAWSPDAVTHEVTLRTILSFTRFDKNFFSDSELKEIINHFVVYNPSDGKSMINYVKVLQKNAEFWEDDVKFDVIIGNPPYQSGRRQVYADFYRMAADLNPELLCLIFPLGWQKVTNTNGLKQLNNIEYKRDPHLVLIDNYYENDNRRIFPEIGTGGVNIVLRDNKYDNHGQIRKFEYGKEASSVVLPVETHEVEKPAELDCLRNLANNKSISSLGSARRPYGFCAEPLRRPWKYQLSLEDSPQKPDDVRLFGLFSNGERGYKYIPRKSLPKSSPNLDAYKLFVPKAWGNMSRNIGLGGSYSNICVARPGDVCAETFIEFGPFANQDDAFLMAKYFMTKFFRACLFLAKTSQNTARDKYCYVPLLDFGLDFWQKGIAKIDESLFEQFQIPVVSRDFIRQNFQDRSEENITIL